MQHPVEPFRIKAVEPVRTLQRPQREKRLREAGFNLFNLRARDVYIDLLTDSGTGAMSDRQWAGLLVGDESYAGSRGYYRLVEVVNAISGFEHVIPCHQGRATEHLLFAQYLNPGDIVVSDTFFDTTRANVIYRGATPVDLPHPSNSDTASEYPFKGNLDTDRLQTVLDEHADRVKMIILTVTSNSVGGQPVSLDNMAAVRDIAREAGIPFYLDAARFAENSYFIRERQIGQSSRSIEDIARETFSYADGFLMSAKKDGLVNIGGVCAFRDRKVADAVRELMVVTEGFPTYGGLAGRDLEAVSRGLEEVTDLDYLRYRIEQVRWLGEQVATAGLDIVRPTGGHAVFIDAGPLYPHIPAAEFPGHVFACALYHEAGVRAVEIGSLMFGNTDPVSSEFQPAPFEFVRLALPRRVYTESHLRVVVDACRRARDAAPQSRGFEIEYESPHLRHFTARLREKNPKAAMVGS